MLALSAGLDCAGLDGRARGRVCVYLTLERRPLITLK
jgi:hypothetical protein